MSDDSTAELRRINWTDCCGCAQLFRAFKLAVQPTKLILAFCGVFGTYVSGRILDGIWAEKSSPVVMTAGNESELEYFVHGGGRAGTCQWIKQAEDSRSAQRVGAFALLMRQARVSVNLAAASVLALNVSGVLEGVHQSLMGVLWLVAMHPLYAIIFLFLSFLIWGLFGGAVCRAAAMHATRDERIGVRDALGFAQSKLGSFFVVPLMPLGLIFFFGLLLFIGGMVGAIPAIGEVLVGILFFLALIAGFILAFVMIGTIAGYSMMYPTIAVEGSDAFDALSRTFSYVYQRPWRTTLYYLLSIGYGAVCVLFVKFFVRLMLWAMHLFVAMSMNWGSPFTANPGEPPPKLDAIWQAPSLSGTTPFYGSFDDSHRLTGMSWFGQLLVKTWIYLVYGFVAAFLVSLFYCASTLIYLLLRRDVDMTDLEDVFLEDAADDATVATPPAAQSTPAGSSLPIIGQGT